MINMEEAETIVNSVLSSLNDLSEDLGDTVKAAVGSPIKFIKVKNNLKKWAKFKLDVAAVEMDSMRKKQAAGEELTGVEKEKLDTAVKAKKSAIKGKMDDINDRLSALAVNDALKAVVRLGKTKASLEANTKLLKIAQAEENDTLKLKIENQIEDDKESIINAEDQLKSYAAAAEDKPAKDDEGSKPQEETPEQKAKAEAEKKKQEEAAEEKAVEKLISIGKDKETLASKETDPAEKKKLQIEAANAKIKAAEASAALFTKQGEDDKAKIQNAEIKLLKAKIAKLEGDESANTEPNKPEDSEAKDKKEKQKSELTGKIKNYKGKLSNPELSSDTKKKISDNIKNWEKQLSDLGESYSESLYLNILKEMSDLDKELGESIESNTIVDEHLSNDISTRFRDLMNKMK